MQPVRHFVDVGVLCTVHLVKNQQLQQLGLPEARS
jgi:hypothetical protein